MTYGSHLFLTNNTYGSLFVLMIHQGLYHANSSVRNALTASHLYKKHEWAFYFVIMAACLNYFCESENFTPATNED